jgi:hypothetical protein
MVIDLDVKNPYFTIQGIRNFFKYWVVEIKGPSTSLTSNDAQVRPMEINRIFTDETHVIIDLSRDLTGSMILSPKDIKL